MRMSEVKIGAMYTAKISNVLTTVRVDAITERYNGRDGLDVTNLRTDKTLHLCSAMKLRREVKSDDYSGEPTRPFAPRANVPVEARADAEPSVASCM